MKTKLILISLVSLLMTFFVGVSSAQDDTRPPFGERDRAQIARDILQDIAEIVSEATGLSGAEILQEVRNGSTLSEIIAANGADVDAIKAEVNALLTERINTALENETITQARADTMLENLPEHITRLFDEVHQGRFFPRENGIIAILIGLVSDSTGLTEQAILQEVRDGATIAEIIAANGADVETIVSAAMLEVIERTNSAVENGNLSQERADEILARSEEMLRSWLNGDIEFPRGEWGQRGNRGGRGNGNGGNDN